MALLALKTGLRFSEIIALEWGDLDLDRALRQARQASVRGHLGTPKNGRIRYVPLTADVVETLRALEPATGLVLHRDGRMLTYSAALHHLHRACRTAGIASFGWHVFRHTYASRLACKGASLKAIQELLGHATVAMTLRYAHLSPGALRAAVDLLEPEKVLATGRQWTPQESQDSVSETLERDSILR